MDDPILKVLPKSKTYGRSVQEEEEVQYGRSTRGQPKQYGRSLTRDLTKRVFNSLPGEVLRVLGTYGGGAQCVGGAREVVTDLPTGLYDYQSKLGIINSDAPEEGSVAIMPAGRTGHLGVVIGQDGDNVLLYDVNADGKNTQMIRSVPVDKIDGYYKGKPESVKGDYIAKAQAMIDTPIDKKEQKLIAKAEKEVVRYNTEEVFDELKEQNPEHAEEIGGVQGVIQEAVNNEAFMEQYKEGLKTFFDPTIGALKGVVSTVENASELGQRGLRWVTSKIAEAVGLDDAAETLRDNEIAQLTPGIEEALDLPAGTLTTPANGWQEAGFFLEKVAEFMIPGKAVMNAQKAIGATKAISGLPKVVRGLVQLGIVSGTEAATFGGVSAIHEGRVLTEEGKLDPEVKTSMLIGGLVPVGLAGLGALKKAVSPTVQKLIYKAIRPSVKNEKAFRKSIDPVLREVYKRNPNIKTIQQLDDAVKEAADDIWKQIEKQMAKAGAKAEINGKAIYEKIVNEVSKSSKLRRESPELLKKIMKFAKKYKNLKSVTEADDILRETNLNLKTVYNRARGGVGSAQKITLDQKLDEALARALREAIDDAVKRANVPAVKPLRELYGKLATFGKETSHRAVVFNRQNVLNLQQGINVPQAMGYFMRALKGDPMAAAQGVGQLTASKIIKWANSADTQIAKAFKSLGKLAGAISPRVRALMGAGATMSERTSEEATGARNELEFENIELPTTPQASIPPAPVETPVTPQTPDIMSSVAKLLGGFVPTAHAKPRIPTAPAKPIGPSVVKATRAIAPEASAKFDAIKLMAKKLGQLTPEDLERGAPKPKQQAGLFSGLAQRKKQLEETIAEIEGKKPPMKKPLVDIFSQSAIGQGIQKAKSIFKKAFNF